MVEGVLFCRILASLTVRAGMAIRIHWLQPFPGHVGKLRPTQGQGLARALMADSSRVPGTSSGLTF